MSNALPKVFDSGQLTLFPTSPRELCKRIGISWWAAVHMHQEDLISFDPAEAEKLDESQMAEFTFVGSIIAADCALDLLEDLLAGLTKPYCYSHSQIYYHWPSKEWRMIPEASDEEDEFQPSLMWKLIPRFPLNPRDHNLLLGFGRLHEQYAAAYEWLDKLGEIEDAETLQDVRTHIDQLLVNLDPE